MPIQSGVGTANLSSLFTMGMLPEMVGPEVVLQNPRAFRSKYMELTARGLETPSEVRELRFGSTKNYHLPLHGAAAGTAAGAAGADVSWLLPAVDYNTAGLAFAKVSWTLKFKNGTVGKIISITGAPFAYTITVRPLNVTDVIPALAANEPIWQLDNQQREGALFGDGIVPEIEKELHFMQIIQHNSQYTGSTAAGNTWFSFGNGRKDFAKFTDDINQQEMARTIDSAIFWGPPTGNNAGANESRLTGMIPFVEAGGNTLGVANLNISAMRNMINLLETSQASVERQYDVEYAQSRAAEIEDMGLNTFPNGGVVYANNKGLKMIDLGYSQVSLGGYTLNLKMNDALNRPESTGIAGYSANRMVLWTPNGRVADTLTGGTVPLFELKYLKNQNADRRFMVIRQGMENTGGDFERLTFQKEFGTLPKVALAWGLMT